MMQLLANEIREAIKEMMVDAWTLTKIHYGSPMLTQTDLPYGCIRLDSVPISGNFDHTYQFTLFYVGKWSAGDVLEVVKVDKANELVGVLIENPLIATYGYDPQVTNVNFLETDDPDEPTYVIEIGYEVSATWCGG